MARLTKEQQKRKAELLSNGLKECGTCGRVLPVEQFSKNKNTKDKLASQCKECNNQKSKQYYEENQEEKKQYQRQYNEEHKEEIKQYKQQYRQQYYEENKEKLQQYSQQYYEENKEKIQQYYQTPQGQIVKFNAQAKRRKREEEQGAGINKEQWLEMMQFFDFKCAYSDISLNKKNRSIDHIIPLVKDGQNEIWNLVPMDKRLNSSKRDTDIMEWYTAQDFYSKERLDKILAWQEYAYNKWSKEEKV